MADQGHDLWGGVVMSGAEMTSDAVPKALGVDATTQWHRFAVVIFACINVASLGVFFAVFVGIVMSPPNLRTTVFALVVGGFSFAVLVTGQFFYWSTLALRALRPRSS